MNKRIAIIISPNWGDYAKKYLEDFLNSVEKQDYQSEIKLFITDNESSNESFGFLSKNLKNFSHKIIRNKTNDGYAKGCNDSIKKAMEENFEYIAIFNIHTILEPNCLTEAMKVLNSDEGVGAVQGRMMLWPEKELVSSLGNATHFLGFGYCQGYRKEYQPKEYSLKNPPNPLYPSKSAGRQGGSFKDIFYPSGSFFLTKKEVLEKVGLFDEEYWMYNEDQELGWRIWLAGWRCVLAPRAVLYNKYEFQRSIKKFYWMDRNRILAILECYHFLTLLLILPVFIVMELGLILFSLKTGWFKEKIKVWKYFFIPRNWFYIKKARTRNQSLRKVKDKYIVKKIVGRIWYQEVDDIKLRLINPIFNLYWKTVRFFIIW